MLECRLVIYVFLVYDAVTAVTHHEPTLKLDVIFR